MVSLHAFIAAIALSGMGGQTVLLDFYTDWCGPCREMNPTIDALIKAGYPVQRVNADKNRELATKFGVHSFPTFIVVANGREIGRTVGRTSYTELERMCKAGASAAAAPPPLSIKPATMLADLPSTAPPMASRPSVAMALPNVTTPLPNNTTAPSAGASDAALLAASVRLRIEDPDGRSCGSGTIIDCRGNEALVLTCGHIFRDSKGEGRITVDLFGAGEPQPVEGRRISYNLANDVALVAIRVPRPVGVAHVAPPGYRIKQGAAVASVGCNNGDPPTVRRSQINRLNRYQGPANIQVAGQPVEGRSGGGLFSNEGYVIGVCNAADPGDHEGIFAATELIYAELDRDNLAHIYRSPAENPVTSPPSPIAAVAPPPMPGTMPSSIPNAAPSLSVPGPMPGPADLAVSSAPPPRPGPSAVMPASAVEPIGSLRPSEQAAWEELERSRKEGAEVVCVVRPRGNSDAKSQVIVLDHVSREFVQKLSAEGRPQERTLNERAPIETSLASKPRKVLLEWTSPQKSNAASSASER